MLDRADRLAVSVAETGLDSLLVTELTNVRYLTGFAGTNGACLIGPESRVFLTDFRYTERAAAEVEGWSIEIVSGEWLGGLAERLHGRVGIEDDHVTVRTAAKLKEAAPDTVELVEAGGSVEALRRVKDASEIERIAAAAELTDALYNESMERGLIGKTEAEVAAHVVARMREEGAEPSFPPIVASGPNGASPHAEPGPRVIGKGELVTMDMGALLDGYCSDCTRTFATGMLEEEASRIYEITLEANDRALAAVRAGAIASDVDAVARDIIKDAGYGENFGHGLGHGVGLEVHEGPRLGTRSEDVLAVGEVVTIEPGIYVSGLTGVRIEDLVVVGENGIDRNLSSISKALTYVE
ncbi:MAG TPA: aminopeptidase P family protein [Solirubrobacterales bacterium]|nr:aminopeptidase P family protein [Solirubrobacterales bacterium]